MNEVQEIMVAADYVQKIAEGETAIVDMIEERFAGQRVIILDVVLADGLERAQAPTPEGMHALARLVRLGQVIPTER